MGGVGRLQSFGAENMKHTSTGFCCCYCCCLLLSRENKSFLLLFFVCFLVVVVVFNAILSQATTIYSCGPRLKTPQNAKQYQQKYRMVTDAAKSLFTVKCICLLISFSRQKAGRQK